MTEPDKGGRPAIGKQITVTVPERDLDVINEMATKAGVKQPDVIREIIRDAVSAAKKAEDAAAPLTARLRPAATLIVEWISRGGDLQGRRERFQEYARVAGHPLKVTRLLVQIAGTLAIDGVPLAEVSLGGHLVDDLASNKSAGPLPGWQLRAMLFFEVGNLMTERGVTVGPLPGEDSDDGMAMEFGAPPDDGEYA